MADLSYTIGVAVMFVSLGAGALALYLLHGGPRLEGILSAFAQVTLVPERRRRFLLLLWIMVVCFLVTGVLLGLYRLGIQLTADSDLLFTTSFLVGMIVLALLVWVGLHPRPLTESERTAAERDAPAILESIWTIPYRRLDELPSKRRRR